MAKPKAKKKPAAAAAKPAAARAAKKPAAKTGKARPAAAKPTKTANDPNKDRRALAVLMARHGEPEALEIEAFGELIDDAGRAELGNRTKSAGVLRDGIDWAATISATLTDAPAALAEHYRPERFRYFLYCLRRLDAAIETMEQARRGQGASGSHAADREATARDARADLLAKLTSYAGAREPERAALAEAIGTSEDFTALGSSIERLVKLSRFWLGRDDKKSQILCRAAGLTESVVDRALTAAEALTAAAIDGALAGRRSGTDSPAVNIAEGSVLFEMAEAETCFARAHARSPVVPKLTPGAATRHVLGPRKGKGGAGEALAPVRGGAGESAAPAEQETAKDA